MYRTNLQRSLQIIVDATYNEYSDIIKILINIILKLEITISVYFS